MKTKNGKKQMIGVFIMVWLLARLSIAEASTLSYTELWAKIIAHSPQQRAAQYDIEADDTATTRADLHWLPSLYVDARSFRTNDPGQILFSKLSERSITGSDFSPYVMNNPDPETHSRLTLGARLMLFEGGAKFHLAQMRGLSLRAQNMMKLAITSAERNQSAALYASLISAQQVDRSLENLKDLASSVLSRYQLGRQDNPVGQSGLLGLKTLLNRVNGEKQSNEAKIKSLKASLAEMAGLGSPFEITSEPFEDFCDKNFVKSKADEQSYQVQAQSFGAEAQGKAANAEYARYLPQIGLFGEQYHSSGPITKDSSYSGGIFLRWELEGSTVGAVSEAQSRAASASAQVENLKQQNAIARERLSASMPALKTNLRLAEESVKLLSEQSEIAKRLFQSGSLNALQFTEVLNRRVDLVMARAQMQESYAKMLAEAATLNNEL